jgi:uncharacterized membrane protein YdjX (TVP38/TMEM64 family)
LNFGRKISWDKWIKALLLVLLIVLTTLFVRSQNYNTILPLLQKNPGLCYIILLAVYAGLGFTVIPSEPLTIFIVSICGPLVAIILATVGNTLAAMVEFFIGEKAGDFSDFEKQRSKLPFHLGELPINSPVFLILGRMVPWFGAKFLSVVCGAYQVSLFTYIWTTLLANVVGSCVVAYGGYGLIRLVLGFS